MTMDGDPLVYYKVTLWAFGSDELIKPTESASQNIHTLSYGEWSINIFYINTYYDVLKAFLWGEVQWGTTKIVSGIRQGAVLYQYIY